jgi:PAS domain S-box-containing protein
MAHQAAHVGAFEWNVQTGVNTWTPELEAMYGLKPGQFGGTEPAWEQLVHPEDRAKAVGVVERAFETFQPEEGEWRVVWPDGSVHWLVGRFQVFKDYAGKPLRLAGVNLDITDRKRAEEELNDFASIVAHDLKAPLRGVATIAGWLRTGYAGKLDDKGRERLAQMNQRVRRMDRMIEEILEYSRLGRTREEPEPVALAQLVPLVVHDLALAPHVRIRIAPGLPMVQGKPVRLRQVFQNLIGNAIKYADKPQVDIRVDWAEVGSLWEFRVADNGPGIEEKHFERIFKMFQTLAPKDRTDSTGVGLALVKRIVERAGGRVWVESRLGEGSTFHFTWPKGPRTEATEMVERMAA